MSPLYCVIFFFFRCAVARALGRNVTLTAADLRSNELTDSVAAALARALRRNRVLTSLDLSLNAFDMGGGTKAGGGPGAEALLASLKTNPVLFSLGPPAHLWLSARLLGPMLQVLRENRPSKRFAEHFHTFRVGRTDPHGTLDSADRIPAPLY